MINLIDALLINTHMGNDVAAIIEDYQIVNDCTEAEAIDALVDKIMEIE